MRARTLAVPAVLAALLASPARGQEAKKGKAYEPPEPAVTRWEVTVGGAGGFGVETADMDAALSAAGYVPSTSGDFLSATLFPSIRFRIGERTAIGLSFSSTKLGSATGTGNGTVVTVHRSSMDLALVAFWRPLPWLRAGGGPAWYRLTATLDATADRTVSKIGWIAEAGLSFPEGGRWYGDLGVQYRGTGTADFGTYAPPAKGPLPPAPISLDGIGCAHGVFVAGIGFRF